MESDTYNEGYEAGALSMSGQYHDQVEALRGQLQDIISVGFDYDGRVTSEGLRACIDKMVRIAKGEAERTRRSEG